MHGSDCVGNAELFAVGGYDYRDVFALTHWVDAIQETAFTLQMTHLGCKVARLPVQ